MKSMTKHSIILLTYFVISSLIPDTSARPNGVSRVNELFTALVPSATGKPGTGEYKVRDLVNDNMKNNLAFLNEICPPLARVADQLCQAVQNMVQRGINFFVGGGNVPKLEPTTTESPEGTTTSEGTAEETTPSSGSRNDNSSSGNDNSNPKFGGTDSTSEGSSTSEGTSSTETSSENSTDKPDKEGETTTAKQ